MRRTVVIAVSALALSGLVVPPASAATPGYVVVDLGTLGGTSVAHAINNASPPAVAGYAQDASGAGRAFVWTESGGLRDIGPAEDVGFGIDVQGRVVGSSYALGGPFVWTAGTGMQLVGSLGGGTGSAFDVDATAGIVGTSATSAGPSHAFRFVGQTMTDLGTLDGTHSFAEGVNASGVVVGVSQTATGVDRAVLWDETGRIRDLGVLGGSPGRSGATSVNDAGVVVGFSSDNSGATRAFLHDGTTMRDLGALPVRKGTSYALAYDVNNRGQVVGVSLDRAVLWQGGRVVDLNTQLPKNSGWTLIRAYGINDSGWVVGFGNLRGGRHAFLLKPR